MLSCGWLVQDDFCYNEAKYKQLVPEEDNLFCTFCNAEVFWPAMWLSNFSRYGQCIEIGGFFSIGCTISILKTKN